MKPSPGISERCRKLNNADINALLAHIETLESIVSAELSGPETKRDKPFMYAIMNPQGDAYFDDDCVSGEKALLEENINNLDYAVG
ncbi:hypothetical protein LU631_07005 [Erwinia tracheiphila]|uniref:Uncharacterized protein n=1 Tax=Erwinia tracheiphila TaxID=65700 RepID=A0A0M2KK57_9GAMM|nr:hypothetical protein [Erwinia tracheiphila]EOS93122.1 hypothetical protein ETR_20697 [Erwinia tracheiphila PSU-1]KKF37613.1 hypothetical protein SY86_23020 [Erwinia tracheiphila]UIA89010.1 hypothetical protein LU631_07005 [Erwinia tracheiphila]UIA97393.1 hypothetical protein LU633_05685 [Erwinia tracheiphila]